MSKLASLFSLILTTLCCSTIYWTCIFSVILLAYIKKCKWNSDFTHYLLQDDTNTTTIQPLNFQLIIIKVGNVLSTALSGRSKVNHFSCTLASILRNASKSVWHLGIQQSIGIVIQKIFGMWDFSHPVFSQFVLKLSCRNCQTILW